MSWIIPVETNLFHCFRRTVLFLWIGCHSFKHRIKTCHNSCCWTSINCQAIRKKQALSDNERNWHRPIETTKNVVCLQRFGGLPWSVLHLHCTSPQTSRWTTCLRFLLSRLGDANGSEALINGIVSAIQIMNLRKFERLSICLWNI